MNQSFKKILQIVSKFTKEKHFAQKFLISLNIENIENIEVLKKEIFLTIKQNLENDANDCNFFDIKPEKISTESKNQNFLKDQIIQILNQKEIVDNQNFASHSEKFLKIIFITQDVQKKIINQIFLKNLYEHLEDSAQDQKFILFCFVSHDFHLHQWLKNLFFYIKIYENSDSEIKHFDQDLEFFLEKKKQVINFLFKKSVNLSAKKSKHFLEIIKKLEKIFYDCEFCALNPLHVTQYIKILINHFNNSNF